MPTPEELIIKKLYPQIMDRAKDMIEEAAGIGFYPYSGYRDFNKQKKLYAQGRTVPGIIVTDSVPGKSYHNYGLAIDMVYGGPGKWSWSGKHNWSKMGSIGKKHGFEWGKSWGDAPHLQMSFGIDIETLYAVYKKTWKLKNVWEWLDKYLGVKK